jgi:N-dimethylarginine dimethylaminohydrolase
MVPRTTGSEIPSTHGGAGWAGRLTGHEEEVAAGRLWTRCGCRSEVATLRSVLLTWPPDSLAAIDDAAGMLMHERVDLGAIRAQADAVADAYRAHGVEVHVAWPPASASPNIVFARDTFFMTAAGAVVARMASQQRAGEERWVAEALAGAGFPILATVAGSATFEGADALWIDPGTVVVAVGFRTNHAGFETVRRVLGDQGVEAIPVPIGPGVQHLLGTVVPIDDRLAAVHGGAITPELRDVLLERGYELLVLEPDRELLEGRGMNFVTLAPRKVLMPAGSPGIRRRFEAAGVQTHEVEVGEYLKAAGALGCLTGILQRA